MSCTEALQEMKLHLEEEERRDGSGVGAGWR